MKKMFLLFSLAISIFILTAFGQEVYCKMKAVYGFSRNLEPFKDQTNDEIVQWLKEYNIGAIYGGYDAELIEALHNAEIKVYGTIGLFAGENYWKSHPECHPINPEGEPIKKIKWYAGVCPNQKWLRKEKLEQIRNMLTEYNIDGIWLDCIRYPCHWEVKNPLIEQTCFCSVCINLFQKDTGIKLSEELETPREKAQWILQNHEDKWTRWKCQQITDFVKEAKEVVKSVNHDAHLGIFGVPWTDKDYDNAIERIICQDYKSLANYVDVFSPMVYHLMCNRPVEWITETTNWVAEQTNKTIWPIIQAMDLTRQEFAEAIDAGLTGKSDGVIIFTLRSVLNEDKLQQLKTSRWASE